MDKKVYNRGIAAQLWYNFTEKLVHMLVARPVPSGIEYVKKIKYGEEKLQYINMFSPESLKGKKKPLLIYIHGGSWVSGITEMRNAYISQWALKGFVTASISYSYSPQKTYPSQLQEMYTAIDYLIDNADKYEIDTDNIVLAGESAGGYFISHASGAKYNGEILQKNNLKFRNADKFNAKALVSISGCFDLKRMSDKTKPQSEFPDIPTMVKSYLGMPINEAISFLNSDEGKYVSPIVNNGYPPTFLVWADKDLLRYESFDFAEELNSYGVHNVLYKADGAIGMHAWAIVPLFKKSKICFNAAFDFVKQYMPEYF